MILFSRQVRASTSKLVLSGLLLGGLAGVAVAFMQQPATRSPGPIRIMPLGDSITQANDRYDSYRRRLWLRLRQAGYEVDFVGSHQTHFGGPAPRSDFDQDHEGHWGWRVDEVLTRIEQWTAAAEPDVVLIHLGTNDLGVEPIETTLAELQSLLERIRQVNPQVTLLIAELIPCGDPEQIRQLNQLIRQLANQMNTDNSSVISVDQFSGFDPTRSKDTYDGCHPNAAGERKIADRWFAALQPLLNSR
jgi:lysophospholipase L1-like esterase